MTSTTFNVDAALFDMDGTLVDSVAGVEGAWALFKTTYPFIDVPYILAHSHGIRTVENLRNFCKIDDPELLETEATRFELAIVASSAASERGIVKLPGVTEALEELKPGTRYPNPKWAICTSATCAYATAALASAGITVPDVFVAAEDVSQGKPCPDPYLLGAKLCGVDPKNCVVFEDAPNGVLSGKAAGCKTIAFITTHTREELEAVKPDFIVPNMASISLKLTLTGVEVTVTV